MIGFSHGEIDYHFDLNSGDFYDLAIENPIFYRKFVKDLIAGDEDSMCLSEDNKPIDFSKSSLVISDLFNIDPNSKRILTAIYKRIDKSCLNDERKAQFDEINRKIGELINDIASDFEGSITYNDVLSLPQVLGLIDFKFDFDDSSFLAAFVSYIKAWREAINLKVVFCLNIFSMLEENDIEKLEKELFYLGISLVNVSYLHPKPLSHNVKFVTIDSDLCVIA
jgi:CRISPR type II-A-associated protein Csn2